MMWPVAGATRIATRIATQSFFGAPERFRSDKSSLMILVQLEPIKAFILSNTGALAADPGLTQVRRSVDHLPATICSQYCKLKAQVPVYWSHQIALPLFVPQIGTFTM